jgi:hypothetical protein
VEAERIIPTVMLAGFGSKEVRAVLDRAERLAEQTGAEKPMLLLFHRFLDSFSRSDLKTGLSLADEFAGRAEGELTIISHRMSGGCYMSLGRLREAMSHFEAVLAEEPGRTSKLRFAYVYEPRAFSLINMALTATLLGFLDEAERMRERAFELEKNLAHPVTTAWVGAVGLVQAMLMDDRGTIEVLSARLLQHTEKFKMTHFHRLARANVAYVTALKGNTGAGLTEIEKCLSEWLALGYRYFLPIIWIIQIRVQLLAEVEISNAVRAAEVGLAHVGETGEAIFAAELHRLQGVIALAANDERKEHVAEQAFQTAIEVARGQDAKLLELRAATNLARLWRDHGKKAEAETLLGRTYDCFSEGFAKPDLLEAKRLLQELSPDLHMAH